MTYLNNFLHNDYVYFPMYIGMMGILGWTWWSEGTNIFTKVSSSPVESWPWNPSTQTATPRTFNFSQTELLRLQSESNIEARLGIIEKVQENTRSIIEKLEELKFALNQKNTMVNQNLVVPNTSVQIENSMEVINRAAIKSQYMAEAAGLIQDAAGNWVFPF